MNMHSDSLSERGGNDPADGAKHSEFLAFLDDLSELARGGHVQGDLRSEIEHRVSAARDRMSDTLDHGRKLTARARTQVHRSIESSRDAVTERPLSSITVAAAAGLLIGLLLSRRH